MPVTVKIASHDAEPIKSAAPLKNATQLLIQSARDPAKHMKSLLQSSIVNDDDIAATIAYRNGFVHTCLEAYNQHRHLVIRPDDVWMSILTQFSFYVEGHAEEMRSYFVKHKGKKRLRVALPASEVDYGLFAKKMGDKIHENVVDKDLQSWVLGNFTTTTLVDTICYSILLMATTKSYFDFRFCIMCGIPSVTLLGEVDDWKLIRKRINKLTTFDATTHQDLHKWHALLVPVVDQFIATFESPDSPKTTEFWSKIAHESGGGSGPTYIGGWLSTFCVFSSSGKWQVHTQHPREIEDERQSMLHWLIYDAKRKGLPIPEKLPEPPVPLFDASIYPRLDIEDIPPGWAEVPVTIEDYRREATEFRAPGKEYAEVKATMIAGLVGASAWSTADPNFESSGPEGNDTVQPYPAWFIFSRDRKAEKAEKAERRQRWGRGSGSENEIESDSEGEGAAC